MLHRAKQTNQGLKELYHVHVKTNTNIDVNSTTNSANELYSRVDVQVMRHAEEARCAGKDRVTEIAEYARKSGIKRIGIACCMSLKKEALALEQMLNQEFSVTLIDCKVGNLSKQQLIGEEYRGIACNPAQQAQILADADTELNISLGLCIGHDIVFNSKSKAPVTNLIVKDRQHHHNPYKIFEKI